MSIFFPELTMNQPNKRFFFQIPKKNQSIRKKYNLIDMFLSGMCINLKIIKRRLSGEATTKNRNSNYKGTPIKAYEILPRRGL